MSQTRYLKGACSHCGGRIEFPAESIGMVADCPHCGKPTELMLAPPPEVPGVPRRVLIWTIITVAVLGLALIGVWIGLKRFERKAAELKAQRTAASLPVTNASPVPDDPATKTAFRVSPIKLEKTQGSSLVYAIGTLSNLASTQRFGVKIELELLDSAGQKVGLTHDYQQLIETNGQWQFHALVMDSRATKARVAAIKEEQ